MLAALTVLAGTLVAALPATPALADMTAFRICFWVWDTPYTKHPVCVYIPTTHPIQTPPDGCCPYSEVVNGAPGGDPATDTTVSADLATATRYLGQAATTDQGQTSQLRAAALATYDQAAVALGQTPLSGLQIGYVNLTTGQLVNGPNPPHPWLQQVIGDWTAGIGLLQDANQNPANTAVDRQQAAGFFDDAYVQLALNAQS